MSFNINSDKEFVRGSKPQLIGDNELTIRGGTGSLEREVLRTQLDADTGLPRVGINRTGNRVNNIELTNDGVGYVNPPTVTIDPPGTPGGVQALASAFIFNGRVTSIAINNPGSGYTTAPTVTFTGGGGAGAAATAVLDTVDFELDINGAIRTSTSIISDTARVLNLDIDNFVTPDLNLRGPNLKTYMNGSGTLYPTEADIFQKDEYVYFGTNVYQALNQGEATAVPPTHTDGVVRNGEVDFKHIGFRADDPTEFRYGDTGEAGVFPRSITPLLGDRSDAIATTEYVLNLATNDVGGRIYVSEQIGSDLNDGRSAVNPVRTIKKAAQLAWATPGVKETLIVSGGDYLEDNPISLPPDCSVVGDNLRLVIIRPRNPGKHIMKFGDKNYVIGVTYRDQIDANGDSVATWDFAMVFDDKQRVILDYEVNGDFGVEFPIGHQIFGPDQFRLGFQQNGGGSALQVGSQVVGVNQGAVAEVIGVAFDSTTGASAYLNGSVDVRATSGSIVEGEQFRYITNISTDASLALTITETTGANSFRTTSDPTGIISPGDYIYLDDTDDSSFTQGYFQVFQIDPEQGPPTTYWDVTVIPVFGSTGWDSAVSETININAATATFFTFDSISLKSIRAEGEVVSVDEDVTNTLPIQRLDFSLQGTFTEGFQSDQFGNAEDLGGIVFYTNELVGRSNIHEFKEGQEITITGLPTTNPDLSFLNGKQRIYKVLEDADGRARRFVIPKKAPGINDANFDPGQFATVATYSRSVTLSLLNSPNKFPISTPVERRFQDACVFLRNNRDFIADEVVGIINDEFKRDYYSVYNVTGNDFDIYLGPLDHVNNYISGGTVTFGGNVYNITSFVYDTGNTGVATVTTSTAIPSLAEDDTVQLAGLLIECEAGQKVYPAYSSPDSTGNNGDNQCRQDVVHFINALVRDLEFGSNHNVIEAAQKYIVDGKVTYIEDEIIQNVRAIEYARELAIYCMRNWRIGNGTPSDTIYAPRYSSITRYFDNSVITSTAGDPACADVKAAIDTLSFLWVDVITNNTNGTYLDAAYLIARNRDLIADQALINTEVQYPALNLSDIHQRKCRRDINIVLGGLIRDLAIGGNHGIVSNAEAYFTGAALTGIDAAQLPATLYAYEQVRDLCIHAMRNWTDGLNDYVTPVGAVYNAASGELNFTYPVGSGGVPQVGDRVAFTEEAMTFSCTVNNVQGNHPSPLRFDSNYGNSYPITAVSGTSFVQVTVNVGDAGSASGEQHTFVSAATNGTVIIHNPVSTTSPIPQFDDWNVLTDPAAGADCATVEASITTAFSTFEDILDGTSAPGAITQTFGTLYDTASIITYPDSFVTDLNNRRMAIRGDYDDYPIIEASPYTQNSSVISFLGGSGALVDGSKVKQPNCPFPGLELDGSASFPNQGKSMVASAFTIVSFGGTGYKVIEDGYTQLVSVFVIFCADGVLAESGGYCSITNSATNFGIYALRGIGFRREAYSFDVGTISNVSATPTGRAILTVDGLGREPLEHYVVKIDGISNTNPDIEYFIDAVGAVGAGPPFSAQLTIDDGQGQPMSLTDDATGNPISTGALLGKTIRLHRPSIVNSSSHTWEFAGSGTNYLALPENGGTKVLANEQVSQDYGRVYCSGTDELGDFKVGTFAQIENRTGAITFTGTVTISEVEFLKLKGGDVVVTGFSADNTLGGAGTSNSVLPTQKAVRDYITNNLGPYINKPYSTNAVPRALVELTDSGKISIDQIPALRPFEVYTVANQAERLAIEGALAGDIAIQSDTTTSFILNNDLDSLFTAFVPDPTVQFTIGDIFTGSGTGGRIQATEYRQGVVYQLNITNGGSGYTQPPTVTISGTLQQGGVEARAETTIANGEVVTLTLVLYDGFLGGKGYTSAPTVTIAAPAGSGTQATASALIESRLYGSVVNRILIEDTDTIESSDIPAVTMNITRVVNTSSSNNNNWVSLSSNQIAASDITSGVIETDRLASGGAANSFTFLRGDQNFALAVQSVKGAEVRYFDKLYSTASSGSNSLIFETNADVLIGHEVVANVSGIQANTNITGVITAAGLTTVSLNNPLTQTINAGSIIAFERGASPMIFESSYTQGNFVDDIIISNGGLGFTDGQFFDVEIGGGTGTGLKANIVVSGNTVTDITVTDGGSGYSSDFTVVSPPPVIGSGSGLVLEVKISTVNRQYANVAVDVQRVTDLTISSDLYGTIGVSRFKKDQFNIGTAGNGSIEIKTGSGSGLDADLLDGKQGGFYQDAASLTSGTLSPDRLSGTYNISISNQSGSTLRLVTGTNNPTSNAAPSFFVEGFVANTINNSADGLNDGGTQHLVLTVRNKGQGLTAEGGVRQLAFTDNDNMYLRGSGTGVAAFGSWAKMWTSLNDGPGSGMDADKLDNRQGIWYQNAYNLNKGVLSERVLPRFIGATNYRDSLTIKSYNGDLVLKVYISGQVLNTTPFTPGSLIKFYDNQSQAAGDLQVDNLIINDDTADNFNDYTIIIGRLTSGTIATVANAIQIGTASNKVNFDEFSLEDSNTFEVATLESDSGTANLRLGRSDGQATSPAIYFTSAQLSPSNYNAAIIATGGNATDGSGTLNALVANADGFNINGNVIWNAGNIQFQSANIANTGVKRDANGDFAAGTITANLVGSSSLNVLKAGDTMTGSLTITGGGSNFSVSGTASMLSTASVADDFAVDSDTLFVDASQDGVGINVGTTLTAGVGLDVLGGSIAALRLSGPGNPTGHQLLIDGSRNSYYDDPNHAMMFISSGAAVSTHPGEGAHWIFNGRASDRDFIFRSNSNNKMSIRGNGGVVVENSGTNNGLDVDNQILGREGLQLGVGSGNAGQGITFYGANSYRNARVSQNEIANNLFTLQGSTANGGTTWNGTPAVAVNLSNNRVAINTTAFSGVDPENNQNRDYILNIQGDMNLNGTFFQNNSEFVTSRWTEATTSILTSNKDIYRLSAVGINQANPDYALDVNGDANVRGVFRINGAPQHLDTYGIVKSNPNVLDEDITVPANTNAFMCGDITIANNRTITVGSTSTFVVI
jgi:hypothetical protein